MTRTLKIILTSTGIFLLVIAIVVAAVVFLVNPNSYKPEIIAAVKAKTGHDLVLEGDLKLSIFPWLGIHTGKIIFNNSPGFKQVTLANIDEAAIKVKLLPLLSLKLEVKNVVLKGLTVNLETNAQGLTNWNNLIKKDAAKITKPSLSIAEQTAAAAGAITLEQQGLVTAPLAALVIDGIAIENAKINWINLKTDKFIELKNLSFNAENFSLAKPVAVNLVMLIEDHKAGQSSSINFSSELMVNEQLDNVVLTHSKLDSSFTQTNGTIKNFSSQLNIDTATVNNAKHTLKVSGFQLKSGETLLTGEFSVNTMDTAPRYEGSLNLASLNLAQFLKAQSIDTLSKLDANALSKLAFRAKFFATENELAVKDLEMNVDASKITGSAGIKDFTHPAVSFALNVDTLDLGRYLPPAKSDKEAVNPVAAVAASSALIPVLLPKDLNANGELSLATLKINNMTMEDMQLKLVSEQGVINLQQSIKHFFQGSYASTVRMDVRQEQSILTVDQTFANVQLENLLTSAYGKAPIIGLTDATINLQGQGRNPTEIKSTLHGKMSFNCKNGAIKGFNLEQAIDKAKNLLSKTPTLVDAQNDQTNFTELKGTVSLADNIFQNEDMLASTEKLRITGKGQADLNTQQIDYRINAQLVKTKATATEPEQYYDTPVSFLIGGNFTRPTFTLDIQALLTDKNKAKIDKLIDKLDKKLGPGVGDFLKKLF